MGSSAKTRLAKLEKRIVPRPLSFHDMAMIASYKSPEEIIKLAAALDLPPVAAQYAFIIELAHDPAPDSAFPFTNWTTEELKDLLELIDHADKNL